MKVWAAASCMCVVAVLWVGCSATSRYRVLSFFFDGVPPPEAERAAAGEAAAAGEEGVPGRQVGYREHGPYAARLCTACHEPGAANALVAPRDELCFRCHELRLAKKYVHGPLASGGCTVCHDPHSSQYRYLLVSEADTFCLHCHDRGRLARVGAHEGVEQECTTCHDAHMSDQRYLLK